MATKKELEEMADKVRELRTKTADQLDTINNKIKALNSEKAAVLGELRGFDASIASIESTKYRQNRSDEDDTESKPESKPEELSFAPSFPSTPGPSSKSFLED